MGELLAVAEREAVRLGARRPSQVSGLDVLGVPCWQVSRPDAVDEPGNITVLNGKGWTEDEARTGALMEHVERHWAERADVPLSVERAAALAARGERVVRPAEVPLPIGIEDPGDAPLAWTRGYLPSGDAVWLPAHDVLCPFAAPPGAADLRCWRSTGIAAGAHLTEAILSALLEVLERDAVAVGHVGHVGRSVDVEAYPSAPFQALLRVLRERSIALEVKQLSACGGVSAYAACLDDRDSGDPMRICAGYGAHLDPAVALERAVLEAVQSRATIIAGAREDLAEEFERRQALGYERVRELVGWWAAPTRERAPAPGPPSAASRDLAEDVRSILAALERAGFRDVAAVELSPPGAAITVVRVVVPGASDVFAETYRLGRRIRVTRVSAS